ncbi:MAG: hypothetical protein ABW224_10490 [Kibdelosporangium sp.]
MTQVPAAGHDLFSHPYSYKNAPLAGNRVKRVNLFSEQADSGLPAGDSEPKPHALKPSFNM